jgi:hypothetical protein
MAAKSIQEKVHEWLKDRAESITTDGDNAAFFKQLHELESMISAQLEATKKSLLESSFSVRYFEDEGVKVCRLAGKEQGSVDTTALYNELASMSRVKDFLQVASVSKTALEKLNDGKVLAAKYYQVTGSTKPSITVSKISADEKKALLS